MRVFFFIAFFPLLVNAQDLNDFNKERLKLDQNLMIGLGSWSVANITAGTVGCLTTKNEAKYFHQMNIIWNSVNLALAIPGYFKAKKTDPTRISFANTLNKQSMTEKIFLFNTALDIFYVTGGFYLKQRALIDLDNYHRFRGYGNSLIMQGGFLFAFDLMAVVMHSKHRKQKLDAFLNNLQISDNGIGFKYHF